jgi:hypothetical protein
MNQAKETERPRSLMEDLIAAQHDLLSLAREHGLDFEALSAWANDPANVARVRGLCLLADMQAQLLLSRYHVHAVSRLVQLIGDQNADDLSRRACVDLLKLDLTGDGAPLPAGGAGDATDDQADLDSLRRELFGATDEPQTGGTQ